MEETERRVSQEVWRGRGEEGEEGNLPSWQTGRVVSGTFTVGKRRSVSCVLRGGATAYSCGMAACCIVPSPLPPSPTLSSSQHVTPPIELQPLIEDPLDHVDYGLLR